VKSYIRKLLLPALGGILAGLAATVFLYLLDIATNIRDAHPIIIWGLPLAGFLLGWVYHHYGQDVAAGNNLIFEEIHSPKKVLPIKMAPFILFGTVWTHLFGGSAGREGTAVQMGASLTDQLGRYFHLSPEERKYLLIAGTGAGFGAAIGAPWAGFIFGMEVIHAGKLKFYAWIECLIAAFFGYYTAILLHAPHTQFPNLTTPSFEFKNLFYVAIAGMFFGLTALAFSHLTHVIEKVQTKIFRYAPLKPFAAGILLVGIYYLLGTDKYAGLGIPTIQSALQNAETFLTPLIKMVLTALTVASGFKGGEFIPLVYVGSTLGSALSTFIPVSLPLLASLGFAAVFAGAAKTPLACAIMSAEIFGWHLAPYALLTCYVSYFASGKKSIYKL
jgi:H+/Cl- antiporter ClcA